MCVLYQWLIFMLQCHFYIKFVISVCRWCINTSTSHTGAFLSFWISQIDPHCVSVPLLNSSSAFSTATLHLFREMKAEEKSAWEQSEVNLGLGPWGVPSTSQTLYCTCKHSQTHTETHTVAMSMEAVASSIIRILLFRTNARARQNSWRCPWLKFSPPSVIMASETQDERSSVIFSDSLSIAD